MGPGPTSQGTWNEGQNHRGTGNKGEMALSSEGIQASEGKRFNQLDLSSKSKPGWTLTQRLEKVWYRLATVGSIFFLFYLLGLTQSKIIEL